MPSAPTISSAPKTGIKKERIAALDVLRGGAMILVMLYHLLFDLKFIYNINIPRPITPMQPEAEIIHIGFLWVLFAVSGVCTRYSHDPVRRGVFLYIVGFLITLVTAYFIPSELIVFGVLSCFGACMAICGLLKPILDKIPWQVLFIISAVLWIMLTDFHHSGIIHLFATDITVSAPRRRRLSLSHRTKGQRICECRLFSNNSLHIYVSHRLRPPRTRKGAQAPPGLLPHKMQTP